MTEPREIIVNTLIGLRVPTSPLRASALADDMLAALENGGYVIVLRNEEIVARAKAVANALDFVQAIERIERTMEAVKESHDKLGAILRGTELTSK